MDAIRFENITKTFGKKVIANKDISFSIEKGLIYSFLGENGSGKTSLMNVLVGIYKQDSGKVYINEEEVDINSPKDAYKHKIGMIHQHFKLVNVFSATENVVLGLSKEDYELIYQETKAANEKLIAELQVEIEKISDIDNKLMEAKNNYTIIKSEELAKIKEQFKTAKEEYAKQSKQLKPNKQSSLEDKEKYRQLKDNFREEKAQFEYAIKHIDEKAEVKKAKAEVDKYNLKQQIKDLQNEIKQSRRFNLKESAKRVASISERYGFNVNPNQRVYDMSVSQKQTLEIVKALYRGVDILILDEPTAVLTPQETKQLFNVLRNMRKLGKTIIIITHKLNEVMEISDKVAVLRKGEYIGTVDTKDTNEKELTNMMVGRKIDLQIKRSEPKNAENRLYVNNITVTNIDGTTALDNVSFVLRSGEILGVAGISGSGQKELLDVIAGLRYYKAGDIIFHNPKKEKPVTFYHHSIKKIKRMSKEGFFHDKEGNRLDLSNVKDNKIVEMVNNGEVIFYEDEIIDLKHKTPLEIRDLGIKLSFVPEDRLGMGLVASMDLVDNMMLRSYRKGKGIFFHREKPEKLAREIVDELAVVTPSIHTQVSKLSGGNVQKVLVGREISSSPKVFMAAYPVRGLDINSSYLIYDLLNTQKEKGTAVLFVGEDLDVLMALCDRILVLSQGRVSGIVNPREVSKEEIGLLMTKGGHVDGEARKETL
ncbi:MAG: ATP-binding cassette domain-containing protein [Bacilli bacterium]|nr:ATP-binding cassette domain-containing protein [Bacilli bacterium]